MSQKSATKDEFFLIKLHELALKKGDYTQEIDIYVIGRAIGQNDRGINAIVRLLLQSNFVKKGTEENSVYLTPLGYRLVETLISERSVR